MWNLLGYRLYTILPKIHRALCFDVDVTGLNKTLERQIRRLFFQNSSRCRFSDCKLCTEAHERKCIPMTLRLDRLGVVIPHRTIACRVPTGSPGNRVASSEKWFAAEDTTPPYRYWELKPSCQKYTSILPPSNKSATLWNENKIWTRMSCIDSGMVGVQRTSYSLFSTFHQASEQPPPPLSIFHPLSFPLQASWTTISCAHLEYSGQLRGKS